MPTIEGARVVIPVDTNAGAANKELAQTDKTLNNLKGSTAQAGKGFQASGKSAGKLAAAAKVAAVGLAALSAIAFKSAKNFMIQEDAETRLNAVIKSTGGVAGVTAEEMKKLASELQGVTRYGDEAIIGAESLLLTFTKIGKDVIPGATEAILNVSEAMGQDLKTSTVQLGKALNDPIQGLSALRRIGIQLSEQQQQQVKDFVVIGDVASAQKVILGELETQFGGVARAGGQTLSGSLARTKNAIGDLSEVFAGSFADGLKSASNAITNLVTDNGILTRSAQIVGNAVGSFFKNVSDLVDLVNVKLRQLEGDKLQKEAKGLVGGFEQLQVAAGALGIDTSKGWKQALKDAKELEKNSTGFDKRRAASFVKAIESQYAALDDVQERQNKNNASINESFDRMQKTYEEMTAEAEKLSGQTSSMRGAVQGANGDVEEFAKNYAAAIKLLSDAGSADAFLENQRSAFNEQLATVKKAGLDTAALEQFQYMQRKNQMDAFFADVLANETLTGAEKKALLQEQYDAILSNEKISNDERIAAQQAFNNQSMELEKQRLSSFASGVEFTAGVLNDFGSIAGSLSEVRQNQIEKEIQNLEKSGASEEKIAKKRAQLQRKAAQDQKKLSTFSVVLDTSVAITKTLAQYGATPIGIALAALAAAKGAAELAAIQSQPIPEAAFGGSFEVAPGNPADGALMRVSSDERVDVSPSYQNSNEPKVFILRVEGRDFKGYIEESAADGFNSGRQQIYRKGAIKTA